MIKKILILFIILFLHNTQVFPTEQKQTIIKNFNFNGASLFFSVNAKKSHDLIIVIKGPKQRYKIFKKEKKIYFWLNDNGIETSEIYSYYSLQSNKELYKITTIKELKRLGILSLDEYISENTVDDKFDYFEALYKKCKIEELYTEKIVVPEFLNNTYKIKLSIPESSEIGKYTVDVYIFNKGILLRKENFEFSVIIEGFYSYINSIAKNSKFLYLLLLIIVPIFISVSMKFLFNKFNKFKKISDD